MNIEVNLPNNHKNSLKSKSNCKHAKIFDNIFVNLLDMYQKDLIKIEIKL